MQPTCALPNEQYLSRKLDSTGVFNLITDDRFFHTLEAHLPVHRERLYSPSETLAMFVAQVLCDDSSCQRAVNERIVHCLHHGLQPPGTSTAAYCEARQRLPVTLVEALYKAVGRHVSDCAQPGWLWLGRRVFFIDGTVCSMPDTADNQRAFPQPPSQEQGLGFPQARMTALSCAATGAIIDADVGPVVGKASGELSQMRTLARSLSSGDVLVGDALYETYWTFALLQGLGCDGVFEINGSRCVPGKRRTLLTLKRPQRPDWMDADTYTRSPEQIVVRHVIKKRRGFLDKILITPMSDKSLFSDQDIIEIYQRRWDVETDFRSLKCELDAGILTCRSAQMIIKELQVHLLAYNLIRLLMSEAATFSLCEPRCLSFSHTRQLWSSLARYAQPLTDCGWVYLLAAIGARRVRNRPGRKEPRAVKRRPKLRPLLDLPRSAARTCCHRYER